MSHLKERKEKICLNCNAAIYGRYCHVCGQENLEPKESFWHLVTHFFFDLIHFDGKFFSTLKYLLFKPGFLAEEHSKGRRADYLHPIRLYIFVSAFFFLIMFSFYGEKHQTRKEYYQNKMERLENRKETIKEILLKDTTALNRRKKIADSFITIIDKDIANFKIDTPRKPLFVSDSIDYKKVYKDYVASKSGRNINVNFRWLQKMIDEKQSEYSSIEEFNKAVLETWLHSIPKGLFIALPFYALFLMLFYVRNKKYNYVNHLLFSIYLFSFTFILILLSIWTVSLFSLVQIDIAELISYIAMIVAMLYTYKSLRNYYQQSRKKTILKFVLLTFSCIIILIVVMILLFLYTFKTL